MEDEAVSALDEKNSYPEVAPMGATVEMAEASLSEPRAVIIP